jgi:hypothetical protein
LRFLEDDVGSRRTAVFFAARGSLRSRLPVLETRVKLVMVVAAVSTCLALVVLAIAAV